MNNDKRDEQVQELNQEFDLKSTVYDTQPCQSEMHRQWRARITRFCLLGLGWCCVGLGFLGAVLPVLPTTPFILIAVSCFAKTSPRFHRWLLQHRLFGPLVEDWQTHGAVPRTAKALACLSMTASCLWLFYTMPPHRMWVAYLTSLLCLGVASWLLRRPSR